MVGGEVALGVRGYVQVSAVHNHGSYSDHTGLSRVTAKKLATKKSDILDFFLQFQAFSV